MALIELFEAIGNNSLHGVTKVIRDVCDVDEYKSASFIFQKTKILRYKNVIINLMNDMSMKSRCLDLHLTPLMCALIFPSINKAIIKCLVQNGADVNYCPEYYKTLLLFGLARECQSYALVELINNGADVNQCDTDGIFPLMHALVKKYDNELIEALLSAGANVNIKSMDAFCRTPIMFVSCREKKKKYFPFYKTTTCPNVCKNRKNIASLVNFGANVNIKDSEGNSVLHFDICSDLINFVYSCGGRINSKNNYGVTPLMVSVYYADYKNFNTMLSLGANPNCCDNNSNTPLYSSPKEIFANLLIYNGVDINAANRYNRRTWEYLIDDESFYLGLIATVKYSLIIKNENFIKSVVSDDQYDWLNIYIDKCNAEINLMKEMLINDKLSFYDLCILKITKNVRFAYISESEYKAALQNAHLNFKHYNEFIKIRLEDNKFEKYKHNLMSHFYKLTIVSRDTTDNGDSFSLNYDCLFEICQKYMNYKHVYNLFLASL